MIEVKIAFNDIAYNLELTIAREWHFPRQHDVENHAHGPDIDLRIVILKEHFRGDIVRL
jgi:hypothetical protein